MDVVRRFSFGLRDRWPQHLVNEEKCDRFDFEALREQVLAESADVVTFSRDQAMEAFWEENGYAVDPAGEGPVGLLYRVEEKVLLNAAQGSSSERGYAWTGCVSLPVGTYVSLMTPDDPAECAFSEWVRGRFCAAQFPEDSSGGSLSS